MSDQERFGRPWSHVGRILADHRPTVIIHTGFRYSNTAIIILRTFSALIIITIACWYSLHAMRMRMRSNTTGRQWSLAGGCCSLFSTHLAYNFHCSVLWFVVTAPLQIHVAVAV